MKRMHPMKREQINKMVGAAIKTSVRDGCLLLLAAGHAMRASELAGLKVSDINLKDRRIFIRRKKGSISTSEALLPSEVEVISKWLADKPEHGLLFPSKKANEDRGQNELSAVQIYRIFRRYAELTGVPDISRAPHAFRHSLAQHCADNKMDIKTLQILMGHKDINSTAQYYSRTQAEVDAEKARLLS
jgi:type 1 fimbriae regulatory protein FimB